MKYLNDYNYNRLLKDYYNSGKIKDWVSMRAGIWRFMFLISVNSYKFANTFNIDLLKTVESDLQEKFDELYLSFKNNFYNYTTTTLCGRELVLGVKTLILKSKFFQRVGTYLPYVLIQGKILYHINKIMEELKKSVKTQVPAEFNSPLTLYNDLIIGDTINTEFLQSEIPFGFKTRQAERLLVSGGNASQRNSISEKIVSELIKNNVPSIIFDFNGSYSRLINKFSKTQYQNKFYYFKLGQNFQINLLRSDIKSDLNNLEYLDLFFQCFSMAYQIPERNLLAFKKEIERTNMDEDMFKLSEENAQPWEKNFNINEPMMKIKEFLNQAKSSLDAMGVSKGVITAEDFIKDNKTVIIDLSMLRLGHNVFGMFVILSKIIRYVITIKEFLPKIVLMPNIEDFFNRNNMEKNIKPYLIDLFLNPLIERGFGFIFLANQLHKIHSNLFNYVDNFISLKTVEGYDIQVVKNLFNLQEIQGQGYYSNKRRNTYQIDFLKQLKAGAGLVKRDDYDQPFPVMFDLKDIKNHNPLTYEELREYMMQFGYDFQKSEEAIISSLKKTLFQKDLDKYTVLLKEIKGFLLSLRGTDNIGGITGDMVKRDIKNFIKHRLELENYPLRKIHLIRDDIFNILVNHRYLIEAHPKGALGTDTIRTCYRVGPQYEKALKDDFESIIPEQNTQELTSLTNRIKAEEINIGNDGEPEDVWSPRVEDEEPENNNSNNNNNNNLLMDVASSFLIPETVFIWNKIENKDYRSALSSIKSVLNCFLFKLYQPEFRGSSNTKISERELETAIDYIVNSEILPYNRQDLYDIIKKVEVEDSNFDNDKLKRVSNKLYQVLYDLGQEVISKITKDV